MKTAISLPDETFSRADRRAHELGISRSEFFALAARHYLDALDADSLTEQIDDVLNRLDHTGSDDAVAVGRRRLHDIDDEW
jgi:antitoxin MazE6